MGKKTKEAKIEFKLLGEQPEGKKTKKLTLNVKKPINHYTSSNLQITKETLPTCDTVEGYDCGGNCNCAYDVPEYVDTPVEAPVIQKEKIIDVITSKPVSIGFVSVVGVAALLTAVLKLKK